jgi:hypothetical protein
MMSTGEPDATEIGHVRFGKGSSEKELQPGATSPATYFTSRRDLWEPEGETPSGHPTLTQHLGEVLIPGGVVDVFAVLAAVDSAADTATSPITDCDYCSTTDASAKITHRRRSEPAVPGSLRLLAARGVPAGLSDCELRSVRCDNAAVYCRGHPG